MTTAPIDAVVAGRRLAPAVTLKLVREDYQVQIDAAARSVERRHYATAKAELRGALLMLDTMQKYFGEGP